MNTFGSFFRLTTFGESHGEAIGGIIDGCPAGIILDKGFIHNELINRNSKHISGSTKRQEPDEVLFLSGIINDTTLGTPIGFVIKNKNANSSDYENLKNIFRPSHADFTYQKKYGIRDYRGGGRASAREHAVRVVAGAIAKLILQKYNIKITAWTSSVGNILDSDTYNYSDRDNILKSNVHNPSSTKSEQMSALIETIKNVKDSIGGTVSCNIEGVFSGLGDPLFDKFQSKLAAAMMSINACRGFEFGSGFGATIMKGSEHNDTFFKNENGDIIPKTNHEGGILGGITTGKNIIFKVAFKPVSSIGIMQETVNIDGCKESIEISGRHDICAAVRATSVVEAMAAIVIIDMIMLYKAHKN